MPRHAIIGQIRQNRALYRICFSRYTVASFLGHQCTRSQRACDPRSCLRLFGKGMAGVLSPRSLSLQARLSQPQRKVWSVVEQRIRTDFGVLQYVLETVIVLRACVPRAQAKSTSLYRSSHMDPRHLSTKPFHSCHPEAREARR